MSLLDLFEKENSLNELNLLITENAQRELQFEITDFDYKLISSIKTVKNKKNSNTVVVATATECNELEKPISHFLISLKDGLEESDVDAFQINNQFSSFKQAIDIFKDLCKEKKHLEFVEQSRLNVKDLYKRVNTYFQNEKQSESKTQIYQAYWDAREIQNEEKEFSYFYKKLQDVFISTGFINDFKLTTLSEINDYSETTLSIEWIKDDFFLTYAMSNEYHAEQDLILFLIIEIVDRYFMTLDHTSVSIGKKTIWEETFNAINYPMAIIADSGDLVLYNSAFTHLEILPSTCLKIESGKVFNVDGIYYDVFIHKVSGGAPQSLFFFKKVANKEKQNESSDEKDFSVISSRELGIISSSIAHELNNPLAGILAAISLLELEEWDSEGASSIEDMKKSAKRCKDLVDIFLGFSNSRDRQNKVGDPRSALTQAMDLLRFRMIESGVRIKVNISSSDEEFSKEMNLSLSTMIFYILLGEIVTSFNRNQMVTGKKEELIEISYRERRDNIALTLNSDLSHLNNVIESKLMNYLLGVLGLKMSINDKTLSLSSASMI